MNLLTAVFKNWKTSSAGLVIIATSTIHLVFSVKKGAADEMAWNLAITQILTGIGLMAAGDAGAKPEPPKP